MTNGGSAIGTGVLIVATTGTISGADPPTNDSSFRTSTVLYYASSSQSDGTYEVQVRGGAGTYNVYGGYSTAGDSPTTTKKSGTATVVAGVTTTGVNLAWP